LNENVKDKERKNHEALSGTTWLELPSKTIANQTEKLNSKIIGFNRL